jgi:hypothetical protein
MSDGQSTRFLLAITSNTRKGRFPKQHDSRAKGCVDWLSGLSRDDRTGLA